MKTQPGRAAASQGIGQLGAVPWRCCGSTNNRADVAIATQRLVAPFDCVTPVAEAYWLLEQPSRHRTDAAKTCASSERTLGIVWGLIIAAVWALFIVWGRTRSVSHIGGTNFSMIGRYTSHESEPVHQS